MTTLAVDYYPEHWPRERWETDFRLMSDAGIQAVRMAEFAWCRLEPEADRFEFSWLDDVVELAAQHGIQSILCTPTAAPPAWLVDAHPDVLPVDDRGRRMGLGARRHCDPNSHVYRLRADRITHAMAGHYRDTQAVLAWQIDNELYGNTPSFSEATRTAFRAWVKDRYGTVDAVNKAWGTIFWSGEYASFDDIPIPGGDPGPDSAAHHPSLRLEFHRFVSASWASFVREQAAIIRQENPEWLITTNAYLFRWGMDLNQRDLFGSLDVYSFDNYSHSMHENSFYCSFARSIKPRYWVLEQQSASPNAQHLLPMEGKRLSTYTRAVVAEGCELVSYFRWRQCRFGQEQHHGAILPHSGDPGDLYEELSDLSQDLKDNPPVAPDGPAVGVFFSWEDGWIRNIDGSKDYISVHVEAIHRGLYEAGARVTYLFDAADVSRFASRESGNGTIICAMKMIHDPDLSTALVQAAEAGSRVLIGSDYGAKDRYNVFEERLIPAIMAEALGIDVRRRFLLTAEIRTEAGRTVRSRLDEVELQGAEAVETVVAYTDGATEPERMVPVVTRRSLGSGEMYYVAGQLDSTFWKAIVG
ncbi:MAG: beta-galactosidase [bacterium]